MKTFQVTLTLTHIDSVDETDIDNWDWQALVGDADCAVTLDSVRKLRSTPENHITRLHA
jgi:asparagine synthetase A